MTYQNNYQKNCYQPRRPVKSFQDLEVYQKLLAVSVIVVKRINSSPSETARNDAIEKLAANLIDTLLALPILLASAHSIRFSDQIEAVKKLEEAMLGCNLAVVYLEQFRDLGQTEIETAFFDEQIKTLLATRGKILHLQMSWKKFFGEKKQ